MNWEDRQAVVKSLNEDGLHIHVSYITMRGIDGKRRYPRWFVVRQSWRGDKCGTAECIIIRKERSSG